MFVADVDPTTVGLIVGGVVTVIVSAIVPLRMARNTARLTAETLKLEGEQRRQDLLDAAAIRRQEKVEEWARADAVVAATREATAVSNANTAVVIANQRDALTKADQAQAHREMSTATMTTQFGELREGQKVIHNLVNSQYTELLKAQLVTLRGSFVLITRVIKMNQDNGYPESEEDRDTLAALKSQMQLLQDAVERRMELDRVSITQAMTGTTPGIPGVSAPDPPVSISDSLTEARGVAKAITEAVASLARNTPANGTPTTPEHPPDTTTIGPETELLVAVKEVRNP